MRRFLTAMLMLGLILPGIVSAESLANVDPARNLNKPSFIGYAPDRFIVILKDDVVVDHGRDARTPLALSSLSGFDELARKYKVDRLFPQFPGSDRKGAKELSRYYKVYLGADEQDAAMAEYAALPNVERVEKVGIHSMYATPNDGFYDPYQWYHNQANDDDLDSPEAWDIQTGNSSIILAILDSGTRYYHRDLGGANTNLSNVGAARGNMWINNAELNGSAGVDDDGNGYTDDWIGYDFIQSTSNCWPGEDCGTQDNDPRDFNGHGTHTSGIVGMLTNNGYGMAGVGGGWGNGSEQEYGNGVKVMALRMGFSYNYLGQEYGVVYMDAAAEAFYYAADNGARVASCSWGSSNSGGIAAAATYFINSGGLIFVAAGNAGDQVAGYLNSRSDCISVAATNQNDGAASFTTYGTWVDISAPGVGIYSTYHDHANPTTDYWASMDGTSMACPMAAAVAAMIWSQNPTWTNSQVETQLYSSADDIEAELAAAYKGKMGAGRVNLYNAVNTGPPPAPVAAFVGSPTSGTEPLTVNFTDQSTGSITSWSWTFGDGGTSTAQNPNYEYTAAGTYTVSLTVTGPGGSDTNTKTDYITVDPCVTPTAGFVGAPTSGDYPLNVSFTNQSTGASSYGWNFGDGGTSTSQNPSHSYTAAGTYTVTLTATNSCGSDQLVRTDYITVTTPPCDPPVADFSGSPTSGDYPLDVSFTDASTNSPTSWAWTFGDGGTATSQNPSHSYTAAGTYTVTLTATNACGSDGITKTGYITVTTPPCNPPVAGFVGSPTSGNAPLAVSFTDQSTNSPASWTWDFGDGGSSAQQNPNYTYNTAGTYSVTLTATNSCGSDQLVRTNYVTVNSGPVTGEGFILSRNSDFSTDDRVFNRSETLYIKMWTDKVDFNDLKRSRFELKDNQGGNRDRQPLTNHFDNTYTASYALANLPTAGTDWTWKGEVQDNPGNRYKPSVTITVNSGPPPAPVADFSGNPTSGFAPLAVSFTDLSTNSPTSWAWDFGDGGSSTAQNPNHTYNNVGTYTVSLTATNDAGSDQAIKTGYITVGTCTAPVAGFVGSPTTGNAPLGVSFTDQSTNSPTSWNWDFGDGGTSTQQNPGYTYNNAGQYTVTLSVTNACGSDQMVQTNYITVNDGGPVTGEGYILSRNPDFSTDDRAFSSNETIYMKVWTDQVDYNDLRKNRWELKDPSKNKVRNPFTVNMDNTYTAAFALSGLPSSATDWTWKGEVQDNSGNRYRPTTTITVTSGMAGGAAGVRLATTFGVQNYPNPFNPKTEVAFNLPQASKILLEVFNVVGQRVAVLAEGVYPAGDHVVTWSASEHSSGVYFYRLTADGFVETKKMILLK